MPSALERNSIQNAANICLEIAGIRVAIECAEAGMKLGMSESLQKFSVDNLDAHVKMRVFWGAPDILANGKKLFDSGSLWQLYSNGEKHQFRFFSPSFGALPYQVASFTSDFSSGEIYLRRNAVPGERTCPFEYPLNELLFISLLAKGRGVEVHGAGLIDAEGNGRLFLGQSGAGKTTISRLWEGLSGVQILSDDRIILRSEGGRIWMHGTPWHGEGRMALPARAPLAQICFLRHSPRNTLEALGKAEAVARMFACSFPPFFSPDGIKFTMQFFQSVADEVPCYALGFVPNESVVKTIRETQLIRGIAQGRL